MSSSEWTSFCGKIDAALMPMSRVRRMSRNIFGAIMGAYPVVFSLRLVGGGPDVARIVSIVMALYAVLGLTSLVGVPVYANITATSVLQSLETICEDTSKQYPQLLSFHVRHVHILSFCGCICNRSYRKLSRLHSVALRYIEVKVADVEAPTRQGEVGGVGGSSALSLVPVSLGGGERKTAAGRLRDLNEMPDMLSQEEYYGKKRDILDSV
eukprot:CAMPEP_0178728652 /NCGR_PEP_ID=MMETSP0699-20121125/28540_1 /TAXON_ID=265572 /ORGANISM="Extubocellulus spinifer, Strain CCMP396" /LENGTH=210 /DNA_ID=CAMNT_0020380505 /DNA_START=393 /DNA_END=1026 /DNA_ORIENTATION=+